MEFSTKAIPDPTSPSASEGDDSPRLRSGLVGSRIAVAEPEGLLHNEPGLVRYRT